uniref:Uncharacterized protein n=3 Tax=Phaeomonas parva TaxID=124430 RepID=A0A7S1XVT8_9STRA|mmetsp:Transcript_41785/g.130869  ORF Transcript_41785/g.130869 Transcript_41785/m.130869 type:complete len:125 (+) Transcript_41785:259-633(+)
MQRLGADCLSGLDKLSGCAGLPAPKAAAKAAKAAAPPAQLDVVGYASAGGGVDRAQRAPHALPAAARGKRLGVLAIPMHGYGARRGPASPGGADAGGARLSGDEQSDAASAFTTAFSAFFGQKA